MRAKRSSPLRFSDRELRAGVAKQTISTASRNVGGSGTLGAVLGVAGVTGRPVDALGLSDADVVPGAPMGAVTDRRLLFLTPSASSIRPKARAIAQECPVNDVSISWADGSNLGMRWRAFRFHLPDGKWWVLEANRGSKLRKAPDDEADLMVQAFGDRASEVAID